MNFSNLIRTAAGLANAVAEGVATHQMDQSQQQQQTGGRTIRKKKTAGCTPCEGMATVDAMRKSLGFKVK